MPARDASFEILCSGYAWLSAVADQPADTFMPRNGLIDAVCPTTTIAAAPTVAGPDGSVPVDHVADLRPQSAEVDVRVDVVQGPRLPLADFFMHRVSSVSN